MAKKCSKENLENRTGRTDGGGTSGESGRISSKRREEVESMAALTKLTTNINLEMSGDTKMIFSICKCRETRQHDSSLQKLLNNGEPYTIPTGSRAVINIANAGRETCVQHMYIFPDSDVTVELTNSSTCSLRNGIL